MLPLPNNCRCGKFSVIPKDWEKSTANPHMAWRIVYLFYDDNLKEKKQIQIKGMNIFKTLSEKQEFVREIMNITLQALKDGYNPLYKATVQEKEISENTGLLNALNYAFENIVVGDRTRGEVRSSLKFLTIAIRNLRFENLPINQIHKG